MKFLACKTLTYLRIMAPLRHRNRLVAQEWRLTFRVEEATSKQPSEFLPDIPIMEN